MGKRIVILGSSFAGFTAALELKKKLRERYEVAVISPTYDFLFMPSLIWVPFGLRDRSEITFDVRPVFADRGIRFIHQYATGIEPETQTVATAAGPEPYDYLVIATGPKLNYRAVPGLGSRDGFTQSIFSWEDAVRARDAYEAFLTNPGPVVIGAVQGASCFGAAYEFLFNFAYQMGKQGLKGEVPLLYLTPEPFLAHFGIGGFGAGTKMTEHFFHKLGIQWVTNAKTARITPNEIHLADGRVFPFKYAMLAPPFMGVDAVRACKAITNAAGFVEVDGHYQTPAHPEIFAAGVAVALAQPDQTSVPCGVPKTGYLSEEMAKIVAHNIVAHMHGEKMIELPPGAIDAKCVLDAGNTGIIMTSDAYLEPRKHAWLIPGPEAHWAKLAFEKYFLTTRAHGWV